MNRKFLKKILATGVIASVGLVGLGFASTVAKTGSAVGAAESLTLDDVPGFGRSDDAGRRDNQIAAYQVFLREGMVQRCMQGEGFKFEPPLAYPVDAAEEMTFAPGIVPERQPPRLTFSNEEYSSELPSDDRDRYFQVLYGESAKTIDYFEAHSGELPSGHRGAFAVGGCTGKAMQEVGSIWTLRDELANEADSMRSEVRQSDLVQKALNTFESCLSEQGVSGAASPAEMDALMASEKIDPALYVSAADECQPSLVASERAALTLAEEAFVVAQLDALGDQVKKFGNLFDQSTKDADFAAAVYRQMG